MPYLIDSDWAIDYLADVGDALALLGQLAGEGIAISIVTYLEIAEGIERTPDAALARARLAAFLESVPILPLSLAVARRCARLRHTLRREGRRVHARSLDLIIAATAIEHDLTLVTRNVDDYHDIPGLRFHSA